MLGERWWICTSNAQIKSKERVEKFAEVFTAQREVEAMCNLIPDEMYEPRTTYLEPTCGEGVFLLEILRRKFKRCKSRKDYSTAINSIYGMDIQTDNVKITIENIISLCEEYFKPSKADIETINNHIIMCDSLKIMMLLNALQGDEK